MRIISDTGAIDIVDEPTYSFQSADNVRAYPYEENLARASRPSSVHGLLIDGAPVAVFGNAGGASAVHAHSAVLAKGFLYIAVGDGVVCVRPRPFEFKWFLRTDTATCFGIYFDTSRQALISHGELEVARISADGQLLWSASGADVFSEGFALCPYYIDVVDFNGRTYRFRYENGEETT